VNIPAVPGPAASRLALLAGLLEQRDISLRSTKMGRRPGSAFPPAVSTGTAAAVQERRGKTVIAITHDDHYFDQGRTDGTEDDNGGCWS